MVGGISLYGGRKLVFSERSRSLYALARPSVVCLSVTLVHPTQAVEIFHNISTAFDTLAGHPLTSTKNLTEIVPCRGTPPSGEFDTRGVARYSDFGPIEVHISETVQDRR